MKVLVGMSGGVDSSVVACVLKEQGHDVIGATMSIWDKNKFKNIMANKDACFSPHEEEDIASARALCNKLGIPYHVIDCTKQYQKIVLENFKTEYLAGRTPNPCVICNAHIKFEALPEGAKDIGIDFDKFATGHYTRISYNEKIKRYQLQQGVDEKKDQSYFLYRLQQEQLSKILTPLGELTKDEVRNIARKYGLDVSEKADSQDFYTGDINDILQEQPQLGNFVNKNGKILGKHKGIWNYTIGQRRGLGISADRPLYVIGIDKERNEVVLGYDEECYKDSLIADGITWLSIPEITEKKEILVKLRSSQKAISAEYIPNADDTATIRFLEQQKAVASGQSAVFYDEKGYVLGGGFIKKA
jgi:tRNA-specific 2-thiouridylase